MPLTLVNGGRLKTRTWVLTQIINHKLKRTIAILFLLFLCIIGTLAQPLPPKNNRVVITIGWPTNKTYDALAKEWVNASNIKARYYHNYNYISVGGGFSYSSYEIIWDEDFYSSNDHTLTELNTFVSTGLNVKQDIVYFRPHVNLGFTILNTDIEIMQESYGTPYLGFGMDMDISFWPSVELGVNIGYNINFKSLNFDTTEITVDPNKAKYNDKTINSLNVELNLAYCF